MVKTQVTSYVYDNDVLDTYQINFTIGKLPMEITKIRTLLSRYKNWEYEFKIDIISSDGLEVSDNLLQKIFDSLEKQHKTLSEEKTEIQERCWKGYTQKGMKTMFGKRYPNCVKIKKNIKESKTTAEDLLDVSLRRRLGELPNYVRASYSWGNPKAYDNFDEFIDRVTFSTTRDFITLSDKLSYEEQLELRDKLVPFVKKFVYDNFYDEIKDYFDKEMSK